MRSDPVPNRFLRNLKEVGEIVDSKNRTFIDGQINSFVLKIEQCFQMWDVVEVVSSNTFASIQQVSEDNLKEFLVSILCLYIQMKKSK
jgi:hypothetical protein